MLYEPQKKKKSPKPSVLAQAEESAIYARYSSHAQREVSIEQQIAACMEYANANGLKVIEVYADKAVSGKTDRRPNFQRMMRDAEKGKFSQVIAWKSNRIGRNMLQAMLNEAKLQDFGIRCLYVEEDFDNTAAGRFALRSMMNVNQFYSENMAEDIIRGLYDNASKCLVTNGGLPLGYKKGDDGKYALDPPNDDVVREIYTRVACGEMQADIARDLNERGIKTSRGRTWSKHSFCQLLCNERYTGVYLYGDVRIEGGVPQIVDRALFDQVQEVLKTKKNPRGRHRENGSYLLTGKLFCGICGSPMVGMSGTGQDGTLHSYYACQKRRTEKACNKENVRRDVIEDRIAQAIREYALTDEIIDWIADSTVAHAKKQEDQANIALMERELADTQRATKNLLAAIEQGIITPTTKARLLELEREQARLAAKIATERADIIVVPRADIVAGLRIFRDGEIADKRYQAKLFNTFLVRAYLYDDREKNLKIVFSFSGKKNTVLMSLDEGLLESIKDDGGGHVRLKSACLHHRKP